MAAKVIHSWPLKRYARFIYNGSSTIDQEGLLNVTASQNKSQETNGVWKHFQNENNDLTLNYLEAEHFLLTKKDIILESFSLINSSNWIRGVAKGDSMLIICKIEGSIRRFRVQFNDVGGISGIAQCEQCVKKMTAHFPIRNSGVPTDVQGQQEAEVAEIDKALQDKMNIRKAYQSTLPSAHLKDVLTLCLTDATFPSFVGEVEKMLKEICKENE